ncbi:MAG: hypothetical protein Q8O14_14250 [bacterium]|nr:hypothetical protein [bacterium]
MKAGLRWLLPVLPAVAVLSCGITGGEDGDGHDSLANAWRLYRLRQFEQAAQLFQDLALEDVALPESYGGLGWSRLRLLDPAGARQAFQSSLIGDAGWIDSRMGELFALRDAGGAVETIISRGRGALQADPTWRFSRETTVDWRDAQILLAQVFFYSQRFDSCLARCRTVDDAMALARGDTLSWAGAPSFEAALLLELERLSSLVAE